MAKLYKGEDEEPHIPFPGCILLFLTWGLVGVVMFDCEASFDSLASQFYALALLFGAIYGVPYLLMWANHESYQEGKKAGAAALWSSLTPKEKELIWNSLSSAEKHKIHQLREQEHYRARASSQPGKREPDWGSRGRGHTQPKPGQEATRTGGEAMQRFRGWVGPLSFLVVVVWLSCLTYRQVRLERLAVRAFAEDRSELHVLKAEVEAQSFRGKYQDQEIDMLNRRTLHLIEDLLSQER